jgi:hypothetical protein
MSEPDQGSEPLRQLDELFGGVASALGAETPASVSGHLADDEAAALNNILRLVGGEKLTHTLTRDGDVVVPALDGRTDVVLRSRLLGGEEWINVFMIVLIDLPDDADATARVEEFLREGNRYYGAKFLRVGPELQIMADVPCAELSTPLLVAVMRRLVAVVEDAAHDIDKIDAGRPPGGVFPALGLPVTNPLQLNRPNPRGADDGGE